MEADIKPGTEGPPGTENEKTPGGGALVPIEQVMRHPAVVKMAERLEAMEGMLQQLPEAIGRAVAQAMRKPPQGASGPPVPLFVPGTPSFPMDLQFHKGGKIQEDGKVFQLEKKNLKPPKERKPKNP